MGSFTFFLFHSLPKCPVWLFSVIYSFFSISVPNSSFYWLVTTRVSRLQLQDFEAALKQRDGIITQLTTNLQQAREEKDEIMREFLALTEQSQKLQIQFQQVRTLILNRSMADYLGILMTNSFSLWDKIIATGRRDAEKHQPQQHSSRSSSGQTAALALPTAAGGAECTSEATPGEEQRAAGGHQPTPAQAHRDRVGEKAPVKPILLFWGKFFSFLKFLYRDINNQSVID